MNDNEQRPVTIITGRVRRRNGGKSEGVHIMLVAPDDDTAVRTALESLTREGFAEAELDVVTLAAAPGLVLVERIDYFTMKDGRKVVLPVTGVFVVEDGQITRFSDYFNLADFEQQSGFAL